MLRWTLPHLLMVGMLWLMAVATSAAGETDIDVVVQVEGSAVRVDVNWVVAATPAEVWAVLTDFAHMPDFISNLTSSQVLSREGNLLTVAQKGKASVGPLSFDFDSVREIQLTPFDLIRTRQRGGNLKKFEGTTQISSDAGQTRIHHHSDAVSSVWIPPLVGRQFIANETREQFAEMRQEIIRRKQSGEKP